MSDADLADNACPDGIPAWVMTFADLMSLLLAFFVLLFSFSNMDDSIYKELRGSLDKAFGVQRELNVKETPRGINIIAREFSPGRTIPTAVNEVHQVTQADYHEFPVLSDPVEVGEGGNDKSSDEIYALVFNDGNNATQGEGGAKSDTDFDKKMDEREKIMLEKLAADAAAIRSELGDEISKGLIDVNVDLENKRIILRIREKGFFTSGSAKIIEPFNKVTEKIAKVFNAFGGMFVVSGHTDNIPIKTNRFRSNWELSASRAVSVVHAMSGESGLTNKRFEVSALGDTEPVESNDTYQGRENNRRVEIMLDYTDDPASMPIFNEETGEYEFQSQLTEDGEQVIEIVKDKPAVPDAGIVENIDTAVADEKMKQPVMIDEINISPVEKKEVTVDPVVVKQDVAPTVPTPVFIKEIKIKPVLNETVNVKTVFEKPAVVDEEYNPNVIRRDFGVPSVMGDIDITPVEIKEINIEPLELQGINFDSVIPRRVDRKAATSIPVINKSKNAVVTTQALKPVVIKEKLIMPAQEILAPEKKVLSGSVVSKPVVVKPRVLKPVATKQGDSKPVVIKEDNNAPVMTEPNYNIPAVLGDIGITPIEIKEINIGPAEIDFGSAMTRRGARAPFLKAPVVEPVMPVQIPKQTVPDKPESIKNKVVPTGIKKMTDKPVPVKQNIKPVVRKQVNAREGVNKPVDAMQEDSVPVINVAPVVRRQYAIPTVIGDINIAPAEIKEINIEPADIDFESGMIIRNNRPPVLAEPVSKQDVKKQGLKAPVLKLDTVKQNNTIPEAVKKPPEKPVVKKPVVTRESVDKPVISKREPVQPVILEPKNVAPVVNRRNYNAPAVIDGVDIVPVEIQEINIEPLEINVIDIESSMSRRGSNRFVQRDIISNQADIVKGSVTPTIMKKFDKPVAINQVIKKPVVKVKENIKVITKLAPVKKMNRVEKSNKKPVDPEPDQVEQSDNTPIAGGRKYNDIVVIEEIDIAPAEIRGINLDLPSIERQEL